MSNKLPWVEVDKKGRANVLRRRGLAWVPLELIQNAIDERITRCDVRLTKAGGKRGHYDLTVEDDCPSGFADLTHAYMLYAESRKKNNPEQAGRFNEGEKNVIAICTTARLITTTGAWEWAGEHRTALRRRTETGSVFMGEIEMTAEDYESMKEAVRRVIVPKGIRLTFNYEVIESRIPLRAFEATLTTEQGETLKRTERKCNVEVYECRAGETALLYELGIPVVETSDQWHVNVRQKVPLNSERDNVTPAYLRKVRTVIVNAMHDKLDPDQAGASWANDALGSKDITPEAVSAILDGRFGTKRIIEDPSDREAEKIGITRGYQVLRGGNLTKAQWANVKRTEFNGVAVTPAALPAGKVTPSAKPFKEDGTAIQELPREKWSAGVERRVEWIKWLAGELIDRRVEVILANDPKWGFVASYGSGQLTLNYRSLGKAAFEGDLGEPLLDTLIHEFAHHFESDHLSENYYRSCTKLGARAALLALRKPAEFKGA